MQFTKPGVYYMNQRPKDWWTKSSKDWSSVSNTQTLIKDCNNKWFSTCSGSHCRGSDVKPHLPVTLHVQIWVVAEGDKLVLPEGADWECPSGWECEGSATNAKQAMNRTMGKQALSFSAKNGVVEFSSPYPEEATISTLQGREISSVYTQENHSLQARRSLPKGAYLLKLTRDTGTEMMRLILH
jgi:hypothetical protein